MMPLLLAAMIAGFAVHSRDLATPVATWQQLVLIVGGSSLIWLVTCLFMRARLLRHPRGRALMRWEIAGQAVLLAWFAWLCLGLGWAVTVPGTFTAMIPFLLMTMVHWACLAAPLSRMTSEQWTPWSHVAHQMRFSGLPLIVGMVVAKDLSQAAFTMWLGPLSEIAEVTSGVIITILALLVAPPFLVRVLGARPMPAGPLRDRLVEACAAMGFPGAKLMHWPVPMRRFYNAMVVGAIPRLRYVVFSDDLLRDLQDRELLAVLGHELGHTQHRHMWFYLAVILASVGCLASFQQLTGMSHITPPTWLADIPQVWLDFAGAGLGLIIMFRLIFGIASRACEREADLAGVRLSGDPEAMESALKTVARLSGQPETEPNWRHGSIAERVDYLRRVRATPSLATNHHRHMRYSLILLIVIMLASLAVNFWLNPARGVATPAEATAALEQWQLKDEDLHQGLINADAGDPTDLSKWYQRADLSDRQRLLVLHLAMFLSPPGEPLGGRDPLIYKYKRRLTAFSGIEVGNAELSLTLDNTLLYGLVAGTPEPTAMDLEQARRLLPNVEMGVAKKPDHALYDTIGCVHFALNNYTKALDAFANARTNMTTATLSSEERAFLEELYGRRHAAAEHNVAASASGGTLEKLPLDTTPTVGAAGPEMAVPSTTPTTTP